MNNERGFLSRLWSARKWLDPFTYVEIALRRFHPKKERPSALDEAIDWAVYIAAAFVFALILYSLIGIALNTPSPMVIVLSASMEPVYYRGDIVVLRGATAEGVKAPEVELELPTLEGVKMNNMKDKITFAYSFPAPIDEHGLVGKTREIRFFDSQVLPITQEGDVIVYDSFPTKKEIIHRVVAKVKVRDGTYYLTKGDSGKNPWLDQECSYPLLGCITHYPIKSDKIKGKAVFRIPFIGWGKLILFDELPKLFGFSGAA